MKKWKICKSDDSLAAEFASKCDINKLALEVLTARGFTDFQQVIDFFSLPELSDPFLIKDMEKKEKVVEVVEQQAVFVKPDLAKLKAVYIAKLNEIEEKYNQDKTRIRPAYEGMSKVVREFVYKATGTEVDKFTLAEISNTEFAGLTKLVGEYYQPEFDKISEGDVKASLEKSRRLVAEWN